MSPRFQVVTFDSSGHTRLVKDGPASEIMFAGLKSGYFFRFAGLSIEEQMAAQERDKRVALLTACGRIQGSMPSDVIYPHNETVKLLALAHFQNPALFDWTRVNVRGWEYEREIGRREHVLDDRLAAEQLAEQKRSQKEYRQMFAGLLPEVAPLFAKHGENPPLIFRETLARVKNADPNLIVSMAKLLYERAVSSRVSDDAVQHFLDACPPFNALIHGMLMSWFDLAIRDRHQGEKFQAGRNDMFMSLYLPYCDKFVTDEKNGMQEKCLKEIVAVTGLKTEVLSYDDFRESLAITI